MRADRHSQDDDFIAPRSLEERPPPLPSTSQRATSDTLTGFHKGATEEHLLCRAPFIPKLILKHCELFIWQQPLKEKRVFPFPWIVPSVIYLEGCWCWSSRRLSDPTHLLEDRIQMSALQSEASSPSSRVGGGGAAARSTCSRSLFDGEVHPR